MVNDNFLLNILIITNSMCMYYCIENVHQGGMEKGQMDINITFSNEATKNYLYNKIYKS